jgi:hypothetical protein
MDGHKDTLTDEALAHEIESALSVDPSPQFVAKVREHVAREPLGASSAASWRLWLGAAAVMAGVLALFVSIEREPRDDAGQPAVVSEASPIPDNAETSSPLERTDPGVSPNVSAAPVQRATRARGGRRVEPIEPRERATASVLREVLIPEDERRGFELFLEELREGKDNDVAAIAQAASGRTTPGPPWLEVAPVTIDPLPAVPMFQGEGQ